MILGLAVSLPFSANGEAEPTGDPLAMISGHWAFQSETYDGCNFGGTAYFAPDEHEGELRCELTARQTCIAYEWVVRQSCTARLSDNRLVVESEIEEFLVGEPSPSYWPDNFILKIRSSERMTGVLVSHGSHPTEFVRQTPGVS
ncbi:MAG: hypothetical protein AAF216_12245 [Pseudomonadota bacterium]